MYDPTREYCEHKDEIDLSINTVLKHGIYINGPEVALLEKTLADYVNVRNCISTSNGTDALTLALMAIGISYGDEVITTPYTWISTAEVISLLGATPVFCDIDEKTFNIDPTKIPNHITPKTKAIICVNLFGQCCDMDQINDLAKKHNLKVIEDAAQSFGATYKNKKSCSLADISTTSFFPSKPLGCYGDGGACFTNNDDLAIKIKTIKNHGCIERYKHDIIGFNARLDSIQAAVLNTKLKYFDDTIKKRQYVANYYTKKLKKFKTPFVENYNSSVWAQYSILMDDKKSRDNIVEYLRNNNICVEIFYPNTLHLQKCFSYLSYKKGDFVISENIANCVFNLPCYGELNNDELEYICRVLNDYVPV